MYLEQGLPPASSGAAAQAVRVQPASKPASQQQASKPSSSSQPALGRRQQPDSAGGATVTHSSSINNNKCADSTYTARPNAKQLISMPKAPVLPLLDGGSPGKDQSKEQGGGCCSFLFSMLYLFLLQQAWDGENDGWQCSSPPLINDNGEGYELTHTIKWAMIFQT